MADIPWSDILNLGLAYYMKQQGQKTPNFYPAPLSPEDADWNDKRKALYEAGGSDAMKTVGSAGKQYLSQIPSGPSNFSFMSPLLKNQQFAGGVKIPTFDPSKFSGSFNSPPPASTSDPRDNRTPNPGGDAAMADRNRGLGGGGPLSDVRDPNTLQNAMPPGTNDPQQIQAISDAWQRFKANNPNWAQLGPQAVVAGVTALLGPGAGAAASIITKVLKWIFLGGGGQSGPQTPNDPNWGVSQFYNKNYNGEPPRENWNPAFGDRRAGEIAGDFNTGLQKFRMPAVGGIPMSQDQTGYGNGKWYNAR